MAMLRHGSFFYPMALAAVLLGLFTGGGTAETNQMLPGDILTTGQNISTSNYTLVMQPDCNLVLYRRPSEAVWYTHTNGKGSGCELRFKAGGVLAIHDADGKLVWESGRAGPVGNYVLLIQRDGNIVSYSKPTWDTGTGTVLTPASIAT